MTKKKTSKKTGHEPHTRAEAANLFTYPMRDDGSILARATADAALAETDLYFAFGSNMNREQMRHRCPRANFIAAADLPEWKLVSRGVADVDRAPGCTVHGALWRLTTECFVALDRYEGFPRFYGREIVKVRANGRDVFAWVYVMTDGHKGHEAPFSFGYALGCAEGARQCGTIVDPLFIRDIGSGPRLPSPRPWTLKKETPTVTEPDDAIEAEEAVPSEPLPDFARQAIEAWCREKRIASTKVANLVAFARYDEAKRAVRISGGGNHVTIENVGPKKKSSKKSIARRDQPSLFELDEIERDAESMLVEDDQLVERAESECDSWRYGDQRFVEDCRRRLADEGQPLSDRQRDRLKELLS